MPKFTPPPAVQEERNLRELLEDHLADEDWEGVRRAVDDVPAPEVAQALHELEHHERRSAFRAMPDHFGADLLTHFSPERAHRILDDLGDEERRQVLTHLEPDDRTQILENLPEEASDNLLALLGDEDYWETRELLEYAPESVGRLMTPKSLVIRPGWTVRKTLDFVRDYGLDSEIVSLLFVVDHDDRLVDTVQLRTLILADEDSLVEEHLDRNYVALSPDDDQEEAVRALARYDAVALPVVDDEGGFLGIVTVDDIMDVAEQEATEDFQHYGGVRPLDRRYSESSTFHLYRNRIGWLLILIVVNLVSSGIIAYYEETLAEIIGLAFFIPLLIGSGGNTGAQAATLMVRSIATGDVPLSEWLGALLKELGVGLALGATMGVASSFLGLFRGDWVLGIIVGLAMACIVVVANMLGTLLPFALTKFDIDPATASSPLITTTVDALGLFIYFAIATAFLAGGYVPT